MMEAIAVTGYVIGGVLILAGIGWLLARYELEAERHEDIARAASGMDEFSAPEGGRRHD